MKMIKLTSQQTNSIAQSREADGYAINWSPCGFTPVEHKGTNKVFEGWDG